MSAELPPGGIEVDAALVAQRLDLTVDDFRRLMAEGRIGVLCERGTGSDEGLVRATFYHGDRRARLVLDHDGRLQQTDDAPSPP